MSARDSKGHRCPRRTLHTGVATWKWKRIEISEPLTRGWAGQQKLTAPDRTIRTESGSVETAGDNRFRRVDIRLSGERCRMGVMMLNFDIGYFESIERIAAPIDSTDIRDDCRQQLRRV